MNETYRGYKGGEYYIDQDSPCWVDNRGDCTCVGVYNVIMDEDAKMVILQTKEYTEELY